MASLDAITLRQLRALTAVARTGSLTAAAEQLGLTVPAVHAQIRNLEGVLGLTLLQRNSATGGSQPTRDAETVLEAARRVDITLERCVQQIAAIKAGHAGRVTIGMVSTAKYFAPFLVRRIKELCPDIEIVLREGNRASILLDMERRAVDFAVMGRPPRQPSVAATPIGPHPHGLIAPPDHPLAGRKVTVEELLDHPMLSREEGSGTRILMTSYLESHAEGRMFDLTIMGSNETIKQAVMAGLGLAFLSLHTVTEELHSKRLVTLDAPDLPMVRQWYLVHDPEIDLSPAAQKILKLILRFQGAFLPVPPDSVWGSARRDVAKRAR
ncbi:LysR family regulator CbbR [Acidomonas methanolica]|uniref:LysR family regulator CbbR n=1 Tax=Acidomonas methanolica TaxID=437 RepID=UPI00211A6F42|nr:LysR family transcriptional regulator [Acidomonas methanolica]MCQ9155752.1 LysR family transcriptional regulator [Acidomonas methanolica]